MDLSVNFAGLELKTPLVVASSDVSRDIRQVKEAEECGAGAVILKAALPPGSVGLEFKMRMFVSMKENIVHGLAGAKRLSYDECLELIRAAKRETQVKIGVNMGILTFEESHADFAKAVAAAGADFLELNFSPQIQEWSRDPVSEGTKLAGILRDIPATVMETAKNMKQVVDIPVVVKVRPPGIDVVSMSKAAEKGGADAIEAVNGNGGSIPIDIYDGGRVKLPFTNRAMMVTFGAPLKYYAQGVVAQISRAVKVPVIGTGGMMNWKDVVEMIMFGATATGFSTLLAIRGFEALTKIGKGLKGFMEQQGYSHIEDFRGLAHQYIADSLTACDPVPVLAKIDEEKCTGCGICAKPAHCLAISMVDGKAVMDESECLGCGTCFQLCPAEAVTLVEV